MARPRGRWGDALARSTRRSPIRPRGRRALPFFGHHRRAFSDFGRDMELVHQPADSRQAQSEPARGGVTSDQRPRNVRDAGAFVTSHHHDALPGAIAEQFYDDLAVLRVEHDVAGQLRDGRRDERRLAGRESQERGQRAPLLARSDDVSVPVDRYSDLPRSVRYFLERGSFTRHGGSSRPLRPAWRGPAP